jgi:hypothetical protein
MSIIYKCSATSFYMRYVLFPEQYTLPEQCCFITRHTVQFNFNFVHPAVIPLLGYLPQDMIGTSALDYYHPSDLPMLLGVYQVLTTTLPCIPYCLLGNYHHPTPCNPTHVDVSEKEHPIMVSFLLVTNAFMDTSNTIKGLLHQFI